MKTSHEDIKELQALLVQACINFIREKQLDDLEEVHFQVDSLQASAREGCWVPATDSHLVCHKYEQTIYHDSYGQSHQAIITSEIGESL